MVNLIDSLLRAVGASGVVAHALGILVIIVTTAIAAWLIRAVIVSAVLRLTQRTRTNLDDHILQAARPVILRLVYLGGVALLNEYLDARYSWYDTGHARILGEIIYSLLAVIVTLFLVSLVRVLTEWYSREVAVRTETKFDEEIIPLIRRVGQTIVLIIGGITILNHFNIDVKGLLAVLGVGSLAIAFAAQETIANMIAGFVIMIDRPFRAGDRVILRDGMKCDVYEIGVRSTKFLTFDNTIVTVPNAELVKMTINNQSYPDLAIRVKLVFNVSYESNIDSAKEIILATARAHPRILATPIPVVNVSALGDSGIELTLFCRAGSPDEQYAAEVDVRTRVLQRFREAGIVIPFPQRTVHVRQTSTGDGAS